MRLPTWDELNEVPEQRDVLELPLDQPVFVVGPPGSGKTVLAVSRARMLAEDRRTVAVITYNRMLRRLTCLLNAGQGIARTMQSFVWKDYVKKTGGSPVRQPYDKYRYDWSAMLSTLDGHTNSRPTWSNLVIDEGQDLEEGFFQYASKHAAGSLTVFADEDQALGGRRTTLKQIKAAANLPDPIILQTNHRNTPEVAAVAEHFHSGRLPAATVRRKATKDMPRLIYRPNLEETAQFIGRWVQTRGGTVGVIVNRNDTGTAMREMLRRLLPRHRVDLYTANLKNEDDIALLDAGVTVLNTDSVKGQEFDAVFVLQLEQFIPCVTAAMRRVMYMLCSRARDHLFLMHWAGALSPEASASLPGSHLLERS